MTTVEQAKDFFRRTFCDQKAAYLSVPITGGPLRELGYSKAETIRMNSVEAAKQFPIIKRSGTLDFHVINPHNYMYDGWTVPNYIELWEFVVKHCSKSVYFAPGWNISEGCMREVLWARQSRISSYFWDGYEYVFMNYSEVLKIAKKPLPYESEVIKTCIDQLEKV
jgi:hypothetical protein